MSVYYFYFYINYLVLSLHNSIFLLWLYIKTNPQKSWKLSNWLLQASTIWLQDSTAYHLPSFAYREGNGTPLQYSLAWKIPWMEEPGGLQSLGSLRVGHDWATSFSLFTFMHWRRKWQPTPVFLPGESQGRGSLVGCHLWGRTESDTTEATYQQQQFCLSFI